MAEDIEGRDSNKRTRLHRALLAKDFQIAKKLVERGADVRARDRHGWEPLHALAHLRTDYLDILSPSPFVEMIQVLLDAGADVNALDSFGDPPLYHAYLQHSSLIFRLLADVGADMSRLERHIGVDACQFLTRVLHPLDDTADLDLLPMGVDVNAIHSRGYTLLGRAVWLGSPSAVKALLRRGADPTVRFPLHHAFNLMQHPDGAGAINALIDAGADASKRPLNRAVLHCCPPAFRVIFAKRGRVSKPDFHFSDRLLHAPEGADMVVDLIEDGEIKRDAIPRDSTRVVLHCAIQRRSLRAIRRLLELAEDPGDHGNTPFHYSAELLRHPGGRQGLLALEKEGGLINATNKDGKSPLQLAIQKASRPAVRFLLEQGADPHTVGTFGAVPALFVLEMLKHHTGVHSLLKLVCAGMTVKNAPPHPVSVRSRPRCLDLIHEVRKVAQIFALVR
ncbi:hypothetical protein BOTBODRAFT_440079 [Botryobasidium botryosum FD-172 SS1]|uniref:Uncharacterized protein n=1 Tax=Botryobasidium botryosum (strain FD-172 SS1) TaxID=930990 RepID=A0A067N5R9_BOTB1|nr:hypothetical protein BOTBODRAFT_440079 [Botryobasidium botryosum FD-172 SS1]